MPEVLNPTLYRRLKRAFGAVKIAGEGQEAVFRCVRDLDDKPLLAFSQEGEYYRVCCPYCRDTRFRLWINYILGKRDGFGRRMNFLAICYNEGCLYRPDNYSDFVDRVGGFNDLDESRLVPGKILPEGACVVRPPGPCVPLDKLNARHPARQYLESRNFDPDWLARNEDVSYCTDSHWFLAKDRIIIPITDKDGLKGWQARYVGELPWKDKAKKHGLPPKYFSCPNSQFRSRCIYGWQKVKEWQTAVIVEGPTDRWRFGNMAGGIFGNTMTTVQKRMFVSVFRKRSGVLLLDPEEFNSDSTVRLISELERSMPGVFAAVKLPDDTDPGSLDRDFLRDWVYEEARAQGVIVAYRRI